MFQFITSEKTVDSVSDLDLLQRKIALIFSLLSALLMVLLALSDFLLGMNSLIVVMKLCLAIPFLIGYWNVVKGGSVQVWTHILLFLCHVGIMINYPYNEGRIGPSVFSFFILVVVISTMVKGFSKYLWLVVSVSIFLSLFFAEINGYLIIIPEYQNAETYFLDISISFIWTCVFIFAMIQIFQKRFIKTNQTVNSLRLEQEKALEEVKILNEQKTNLLALLSHDLKSPIGTLSSTLDFSKNEVFEKEELETILRNLGAQSFHLSNILNNTLNWVMTEMDGRNPEYTNVSLFELTLEASEVMKVQANGKNQHIRTCFIGEDIKLSIATNELRIIFKNLIDNAIKFSENGSEILFQLEINPEKIEWVVHNQGKVIPKSIQVSIFDFKARTSYGTNREKGTGLGLPLCRKIASKIDFELSLKSDSESGTKFFLTKSFTKTQNL